MPAFSVQSGCADPAQLSDVLWCGGLDGECAEMGVSCVRRLGLSAIMMMSLMRCASVPDEPGLTGTLAQSHAPQDIVQSCHEALVKSAEPYGLTLAATSPVAQGATTWPIWVTTVYRRRGGPEKRMSLINCHLGVGQKVVALTDGQGPSFSPAP
jgi:hypothetical protein